MTFATNVFKIFETPVSQIMRVEAIQQIAIPGLPLNPPAGIPAAGIAQAVQAAEIAIGCGKCGTQIKVHASFQKGVPKPVGAVPFPVDNKLRCPTCGTEHDLADARRQLEAQVRRPIISEGEANAAV